MKETKLIVKAGNHDRKHCPLSVEVPFSNKEKLDLSLLDAGSGKPVPSQVNWAGDLSKVKIQWILESLGKGKEKEYTVKFAGKPKTPKNPNVTVARDEGRVNVQVGGRLFVAYNFGGDVVRPYLYPVFGPGERLVTRSYPMVPDVEGERKDHQHHRSIWTAHGDVNKVDDWSEAANCGKIIHRSFTTLASGHVYGEISSKNDWVSNDGQKILSEERRVVVYNTAENLRLMDFEVNLKATEGDVTFGDTKEGGILSVRVATSMDAANGGQITNAYGGIGEAETWGKRAQWCDYSGQVGGSWIGIAIFDAPRNFRYPTYWHVRDYGLMTANPFGISFFTNDPKNNGSLTVKKGENLDFNYRMLIHDGDAEAGEVKERYHDYVSPPKIIVS